MFLFLFRFCLFLMGILFVFSGRRMEYKHECFRVRYEITKRPLKSIAIDSKRFFGQKQQTQHGEDNEARKNWAVPQSETANIMAINVTIII